MCITAGFISASFFSILVNSDTNLMLNDDINLFRNNIDQVLNNNSIYTFCSKCYLNNNNTVLFKSLFCNHNYHFECGLKIENSIFCPLCDLSEYSNIQACDETVSF